MSWGFVVKMDQQEKNKILKGMSSKERELMAVLEYMDENRHAPQRLLAEFTEEPFKILHKFAGVSDEQIKNIIVDIIKNLSEITRETYFLLKEHGSVKVVAEERKVSLQTIYKSLKIIRRKGLNIELNSI